MNDAKLKIIALQKALRSETPNPAFVRQKIGAMR